MLNELLPPAVYYFNAAHSLEAFHRRHTAVTLFLNHLDCINFILLTSVSFMYVCVAGNGEMLFFFPFCLNNSLNGQ